ncbi:Zinc protease OS=Castellaniella defragrans OX=75697 GN=HNR28_000961 PE=3 SV=1 [Castellaniella defragrans]
MTLFKTLFLFLALLLLPAAGQAESLAAPVGGAAHAMATAEPIATEKATAATQPTPPAKATGTGQPTTPATSASAAQPTSTAQPTATTQATATPPTTSVQPAAGARPATARPAVVAPLPKGIHEVVLIQGVTEYRLDNGLTVLLAPDDSRAQTTVNMSYRVGSRNEGPGETGMAHLLEHLLFRGTPKHPDALAEFARRGLAANGSTTVDLTDFYATFASDPQTLRWFLGWQADAMLNSPITKADLDAEMTVVRNEMERDENSPFNTLLQQTDAAAYVWHPYGRAVVGARSDVEHVDVAQLRAFYHRYYQPDNAVLIVTGNFQPAQALEWIAADFGPMARPDRTLPREYTVEPVQQGARAVTLRRIGGSPIAVAQYHIPEAASDDFPALSIGSDMLSDSPSGPLYQALVQSGEASNVFGFARPMKQPGYMIFGAQLQPGTDAQAALHTLETTLESDGIAKLDEAALTRSRTAWLNAWKQTYDQSASLADALSDAVSQGDWRLFFIKRLRVQALTLATVRTQLKAWLVPSNRTSGLYLPTAAPHYAPAAPAADLKPWIEKLKTGTERPAVAAFDTSPDALDAATQRSTLQLPNGPVKLALLPKPAAGERVHAMLQLRFGTADQLRGLNLIPEVTAAMLTHGTPDMTRQQIDDRLNTLDAELSFSGDGNVLTAALSSGRAQFPALLDLTFHLLRKASFPAEELAKIQRSLAVNVENQASNPNFLVRNALDRYDQPWKPDDIRYESTPQQTLDWAKALTPQALKHFHDTFYGAGDISLAVVGDFDPAAVTQHLRTDLDGWQKAPPYQRIPDPWYAMKPKVFHIPTPGKANADYRATLPVKLQDTDPRWPALMLANYLLGGSEDSRLWQRVRVKDGLSYSVGSGLSVSSWEPSGNWTFFASMAPQNAPSLERAMQDTLHAALQTGFTQAQVDQGVKSLLNYLQLGRSSDGYLSSRWSDYLQTGRSFAWQTHIIAQLKALTADEVNKAMRDVLKPDDLVVAVAAAPVHDHP